MNLNEAKKILKNTGYKLNEDVDDEDVSTQDSLETLISRIKKGAAGHKLVDEFIDDTIAYIVYEEWNLDIESLDTLNLTAEVNGEEYELGDIIDGYYSKNPTYKDLISYLGFNEEPDWGKIVDVFRVKRFMQKNNIKLDIDDLKLLPDAYSGKYLE